jgi:PAS domain S-box-containing protein
VSERSGQHGPMSEANHVVRRPARTEAALLALLESVARAANEAESLDEAGQLTLAAVCAMTGWPAGHLCLPAAEEPGVLVSSGIWVLPPDGSLAALRVEVGRVPPGADLVASVAATRGPAWSGDLDLRGHGIGSAFAFPVIGNRGVVAVLEFFSRRELAPDAELLRVMATVGANLGRVADRVQARRELEASTRRLEQIIETSAEAFVSTDDAGTITGWNASAEHMFDLPRELALGRSLAETIIPPRYRDEHRRGLARFLATGEKRVIGKRIEITAWRSDGVEIPIELAVWASHDGQRWWFNAFLHDIRDRHRVEEALREAYEAERATADRLRLLDEAKDEFVATVSHELRTPLTSLSGYLELLLDGDAGPVPVHQQLMLQTMARNAGRLRALIEDLLLINQMRAGSLRLELEPTSLPAVLNRALRSVSSLAEARDQRIEVRLEPAIDAVPADPGHLERAIRALLSNAIKFSPEGGVVLVAGRRGVDGVELSVTDRGVGIAADDLPRLFERFYRTGHAMAEAVQGAGLGLTIARRIIEEHGGSIAVASQPGEGSTFTVVLPH